MLRSHDQMFIANFPRDAVGEPAAGAAPLEGPAGGKVEDMGTAGEAIDDGLRGNVRPLESPATGQAESLGAACHEGDRELLVGCAGALKLLQTLTEVSRGKPGRASLRQQ